MIRPLGTPVNRRDYVAVGTLIALVSVIFVPLFNHLVRGHAGDVSHTDHPAHNAFAADMRQRRIISMPHPLYHFTVIGVQIVKECFQPGLPTEPDAHSAIELAAKNMQGPALWPINERYASASVFTLVLFQIFLALVVYAQLRNVLGSESWLGVGACTVLAISLLFAAPIALYLTQDHQFYFGYVGINVWHSPTVLAAKPWALISFALVAAMLTDRSKAPLPAGQTRGAKGFLIGVVVVIGALAKPSFLIALIPAAIAMGVFQQLWSTSKVQWKWLLLCLVLPAAVVLMWQARIYGQLTGGSHAKFAPLATLSGMSNHLGVKFLLSILFPVVGWLVTFAAGQRRPTLNLAWLTFIFGAGLTYFVTESGRTSHGNFLWSAQLALFVLFVQTLSCVITTTRLRWSGGSSRPLVIPLAMLSGVIFLAHVGYGIAYYAHLMTRPNTTMLLYQ
jgi:hypothetical protein